jgi:FkbM family methyltransferase
MIDAGGAQPAAHDCNASLLVAKRSGCPSSRWQDAIASLLVQHSLAHASSAQEANLTFVNVGANKGYNVAEFLQRYHQRAAPSSEAWHQALMRAGEHQRLRVRYGCGLCNACRARPPRARHHVRVDAHAIEMVRTNAVALRELFSVFRVPGTVHHLAMSNYSGVATYRAATAVGLEHFELGKDVLKTRADQVACLTLDAFASKHFGRPAHIDLLSVDVEGQDALVLEGAAELLRARRVAVLEFEFIGRGYWRADKGGEQRLLRHVLARLEGFGYRCYWQGESGRLAPASGPFWCDAFQFRLRSNLVCSHLREAIQTFQALSSAI